MSCLSRVLDSVKAIQRRLRAGLPPEAVSIECDAYANRSLFACDAAIRNSQRGRAIVIYLGQPDCSQEVSWKVLGGRVLIEGQAVLDLGGRLRRRRARFARRPARGSHQRLRGWAVVRRG